MKYIAIILLLFTLIQADDDRYEHYERDEHHLPLDVSYLDLSKEQHKSVRVLVKKYKHEQRELHRLKKEARRSVSELFTAEAFDTGEFMRINAALGQKAVEIQAEFFSQMHALLTPTQKKRFSYYMEEWEIE